MNRFDVDYIDEERGILRSTCDDGDFVLAEDALKLEERVEEYYDLNEKLLDKVEEQQATITEQAIEIGRLNMMFTDYRGSVAGKTCMLCNMRERSDCYENTEKLEARIESLQTTITELEERAEEYYELNEKLLDKVEKLEAENRRLESECRRLNSPKKGE